MFKKHLKHELAIVYAFPILATLISVSFHASYFFSLILFLGVPALWVSVRSPRLIKKTLLFSTVFAIPLAFVFDFLLTINEGWIIPSSHFPRFLGVVPVEELFFAFSSTYTIVAMYEYFFEKHRLTLFTKRFRYVPFALAILVLIFAVLYSGDSALLHIPYAFFWVSFVVLAIPLVYFLARHLFIVKKFFFASLYFLWIAVFFEPLALHLNQWAYPGTEYVGWIQFFGFGMPLEEFLFFWLLYAPAILAWYELLDDDSK